VDELRRFYDDLAGDHDLMLAAWEASMRAQGLYFSGLLDGPGARVSTWLAGWGRSRSGWPWRDKRSSHAT
jgi:hypothetical protein